MSTKQDSSLKGEYRAVLAEGLHATAPWLNDRLGKSVHVEVALHRGDTSVSLFSATGKLKHWRDGGFYEVGGAVLDLTNVMDATVANREDVFTEPLVVVLAEHEDGADHGELGVVGVTLEITEQVELEG